MAFVSPARPDHGGDIRGFAREFGLDIEQCLDLSTGISPWVWPMPEVPEEVWQRLPGSGLFEMRLLDAASKYYDCDSEYLLPVNGSQAAIETIPRLATGNSCVAVPWVGYEEHAYCWQRAGVDLSYYHGLNSLRERVETKEVKYAIVINPNNPDTSMLSPDMLLGIARTLGDKGGFLLVDEAFMDPCPEMSLIGKTGRPGLIVTRSLGKFFGMAGLRLGVVAGPVQLIKLLSEKLGLWPVSSIALWAGARMLVDDPWVENQRRRLGETSRQLEKFLKENCPELDWRRSDLFVTGEGSARSVFGYQEKFSREGILVRTFQPDSNYALLRVGLPDAQAWQRLNLLAS